MNYVTKILAGDDAVGEAVKLLNAGECVAVPTETVYGLAGKASDPEAVAKIFAAKERPTNHPLIVHIPDASAASHWARDIPNGFYKLAAAFWPGPLTIVLKKSEQVADSITAGMDTVALRVPSHPLFLEILRRLQTGIVAPSANRHKQLSPVQADHVFAGLSGRISAIVDGGRCSIGLESTILDLAHEVPRILRAGPIKRQQLEDVLGIKVLQPETHDVQSPGNMKAHYQPKGQVSIIGKLELQPILHAPDKSGTFFIMHSPQLFQEFKASGGDSLTGHLMPQSSEAYARDLYHTLDAADRMGAMRILVEKPPQTEEWLAVNDRLTRAQG